MNRIVIDGRELRTSTGRYVERLLFYLQKIDSSHDYVVLLKPKGIDSWKPSNKRFTVVECPYKEFTFSEQLDLLKQIRGLQPDLVHFTMVQQPILYRGKVVTTMHDLTTLRFGNPSKNPAVFAAKQRIYRRVNKIAARKSAAILTPTEFVKDDIARFAHINSRKITVTLEAADAITEKAVGIDGIGEQPFVFYVGRPQPHKNLERLIEAFAIVKGSVPELKLVLAGKSDVLYERLKKKAKRLSEDIVFPGFVSEGQLRWLYENATAYVFPSLSEGFGLPGLEAMIHGCPVISSNATCLPEVYGDSAAYFDPLDVPEMAKVIKSVVTNKATQKSLRQKGKKQAARYSWQRMAEQTLEVYKQVLGE